jgi:cell division protein ZapA
MSEKRHLVKVMIAGEEYAIRSDETPDHTRAVAGHVDRAIKGVLQSMQVVEVQRAAIMAAMQITDELFRAQRTGDAVAADMDSLSAEIRRWLPPAKRGDSGEQIAVTIEGERGSDGLELRG